MKKSTTATWLAPLFTVLFFPFTAGAQIEMQTELSPQYSVKIAVEECEGGYCRGKVTFQLFRKDQKPPFQEFSFSNTLLQLNPDKKPLQNQTLGYDIQSGLHLADVNFDGQPDLALCDGTQSGYGMPSYQVYLYSTKSQKFIHSPAFSSLARGEYLGMFQIDHKNKRLINFGKSGCCFHFTREFTIKNQLPFLVKEEIEDATGGDGKTMVTTTSEWVQGKWVKKVKKTPL
ncbi:MAG: hypothetical protein IV090_02715 [Candidatus Sericytochromatia bacterium]|nr:hypothetical protein [Candidatus Sericytochromatia bacterium]